LVDYFSQAVKSAAVAVYSAPEKLNEANKRLEENLFWKIFLDHRSKDYFVKDINRIPSCSIRILIVYLM